MSGTQGNAKGGRGFEVIPNIRPGQEISASRLLNPMVNRLNQLNPRGGASQLLRPLNRRQQVQVRYNQANLASLPAVFTRRWGVHRQIQFKEAWIHRTAGTFEVQLQINGTLTGPRIYEDSVNPINCVDPTLNPDWESGDPDSTLLWGPDDYLELVVAEQSGVANFDLVFVVSVT